MRAPALLLTILLLTSSAAASAAAEPETARFAPVLFHDRRDASPFAAVDPGAEPTAYARSVRTPGGRILQYWLYARDNAQDRGIVRTGRHEGDWELVQVQLDRGGRPTSVLASQHAGAESCGWSTVERDGTHPRVYVANGSHAGYFRRGTRDRAWPDPNDEARGDGAVIRPAVVAVDARHPAWMADDRRWGSSRAGIVPGEMDSPRGPAFQGIRWDDPAAFARAGTGCRALACARAGACDTTENVIAGALAALIALIVVGALRRRRTPGPPGAPLPS